MIHFELSKSGAQRKHLIDSFLASKLPIVLAMELKKKDFNARGGMKTPTASQCESKKISIVGSPKAGEVKIMTIIIA